MGFLLPIVAAVVAGLLAGGRLSAIAETRLRAAPLLFAAFGLQVLAFPFPFLPWRTEGALAVAIWIASYGLLLAAAYLNRGLLGVPVLALGTALNLAAIVANGGHMPALPEAMRRAGLDYAVQLNSVADEAPHLAPLVDRFAAPSWLPLTNVYSIGDVAIWLGAALVVLAAMTARPAQPRADRPPVSLDEYPLPAWARLDA